MLKKNLEGAEAALIQERDHLKVSYAKVMQDIFNRNRLNPKWQRRNKLY